MVTLRLSSGGKDKEHNIEYLNIQNLPADEETRSCFVSEPLNRYISIDYSGQESALLASVANDTLMLNELNNGNGDIHSLVAKLVFKDELSDVPISEVKDFSKTSAHNGGINYRGVAKGYEFLVAYGGNADTITRNYGKSKEEATTIYNRYMDGLSGVRDYQDFRRKDWWDKGYILLNPITKHKAYIYDYDDLKKDAESFREEGFWTKYKELKKTDPNSYEVQKVKHFFKRKSSSEKQSINYPIDLCVGIKFIKFGEGCDANTEPSIRLTTYKGVETRY